MLLFNSSIRHCRIIAVLPQHSAELRWSPFVCSYRACGQWWEPLSDSTVYTLSAARKPCWMDKSLLTPRTKSSIVELPTCVLPVSSSSRLWTWKCPNLRVVGYGNWNSFCTTESSRVVGWHVRCYGALCPWIFPAFISLHWCLRAHLCAFTMPCCSHHHTMVKDMVCSKPMSHTSPYHRKGYGLSQANDVSQAETGW